MIEELFNEHGRVDLVGIGAAERYWGIIPRQYPMSRFAPDDDAVNEIVEW